MRRFRTITLALCAMALAMGGTSCKKEKENNVQSGDRMVIGANIEQGGSKTQIGPGSDDQFPVLWSADDSFTLYAKENATGSTFTIQEGGAGSTSAQFEGEKPEGNAPYLAMYPTSGRYSGNKVFTYDIPAIQNSETIEHAGPMVGYSADGKNVSFQNAASWIRIGLKGTAKVAKVVLTYKTSSKPEYYFPLSGRLQITVKDDGTIEDTEIVPIAPGKDDVPTLTLEKTAELGDDYTYFGFLVPERAFGAPAVFTVLDANGKTLATIEKSIPSVERGKVYVSVYGTAIAPAPTAPAGALSGLFTVNESGKQVWFSKGNLYYDGSNSKWEFETQQCCFRTYNGKGSYIGGVYSNTSGTPSTDWGLFGWSGSSANYGMSTSTTNSDYSGDFQDWGTAYCASNNITEGTWRTLTQAEWQYLFEHHSYKRVDVEEVPGYVIAPDDFTGTLEDFYTDVSALAEAGNLVFLPAAGNRNGSNVTDVGVRGVYWSSTTDFNTSAYHMSFNSSRWNTSKDSRNVGGAVRLVTDAK